MGRLLAQNALSISDKGSQSKIENGGGDLADNRFNLFQVARRKMRHERDHDPGRRADLLQRLRQEPDPVSNARD
jgi:hypothetical protein